MVDAAEARVYQSKDIREMLRARYPADQSALFFEVLNATGAGHTRSCDAMAYGLWPSRGLWWTGFEIKVARGDWLNELKQPAKAEAFFRYCHHWYLVSAPGVAKADEIPEPWGWLEVTGDKLVTKKRPPNNEHAIAMPPIMLASVIRQVQSIRVDRYVAEFDKAVNEREAAIKAAYEEKFKRRVERLSNEEKMIVAIREVWAGGEQQRRGALFGWDEYMEPNIEQFALAVKLVLKLNLHENWSGLGSIVTTIADMAVALNDSMNLVGQRPRVRDAGKNGKRAKALIDLAKRVADEA